MGTPYLLPNQVKALNISAAFGFVNALPKSFTPAEISAVHRLGLLAHHHPWVLDGLCRAVPGSKAMLMNIVRMLNERTLYMHKPFEAATIGSFLAGQPRWASTVVVHRPGPPSPEPLRISFALASS